MRGRTNIIARPTPVVNAPVEDFVASEQIDVGSFVEVSYVSRTETGMFLNEIPRYVCGIDDTRVLVMHKPGALSNDVIEDTTTNWNVDIFEWNGNTLELVTDQTITLPYRGAYENNKSLVLLNETQNEKMFAFCESQNKMYVITVSLNENSITMSVIDTFVSSESVWWDDQNIVSVRNLKYPVQCGYYSVGNGTLFYVETGELQYKGTDSLSYVDSAYISCIKIVVSNDLTAQKKSAGLVEFNRDISGFEDTCEIFIKGNEARIVFAVLARTSSTQSVVAVIIEIDDVSGFDRFDYKTILYANSASRIPHAAVSKVNNDVFILGNTYSQSVILYTNLFGALETQEVNFIILYTTYKGVNVYKNIGNNLVVGFVCDTVRLSSGTTKNGVYARMFKYDSVINRYDLVPNNEISQSVDYKKTNRFYKQCVAVLGDNVIFFVGTGYIVFEFSENAIGFGVKKNTVRNFKGDYSSIGFTKTGGNAGDTIKVYVPQKL